MCVFVRAGAAPRPSVRASIKKHPPATRKSSRTHCNQPGLLSTRRSCVSSSRRVWCSLLDCAYKKNCAASVFAHKRTPHSLVSLARSLARQHRRRARQAPPFQIRASLGPVPTGPNVLGRPALRRLVGGGGDGAVETGPTRHASPVDLNVRRLFQPISCSCAQYICAKRRAKLLARRHSFRETC